MVSVADIVEKVLDHSHAPDARTGRVKVILENIHQQAISSNEPPRRIIKNITCKLDEVSAVELPTNEAMARRIRRNRQKDSGCRKEPKSLAELVLIDEDLVTLKGDKFMLYDNKDPNNRLIIFTTNANLTMLVHCPLWGMDGTFDVTPSLFNQLYTVHG